jgi:uncharacterized membrane protein YiaA
MQPTQYYGLNYGTMLQKNQISKPLLQNEKEDNVVEKHRQNIEKMMCAIISILAVALLCIVLYIILKYAL